MLLNLRTLEGPNKWLYLKDLAATGTSFGSLADSQPQPTATTATGFGTITVSTPPNYALMAYGSETPSFGASALPSSGPSVNDSWISIDNSGNPIKYYGTFANEPWILYVQFGTTSLISSLSGNIRLRLWKSSSTTGSSPTEITNGSLSQGWNFQKSTTNSLIYTYQPGTIVMNGEYLFLQVAYELDVANAGTSSIDIDFTSMSTGGQSVLPNGLAYTRSSSNDTVQTSDSTIVAVSPNLLPVGQRTSSSASRGGVVDEPRYQGLADSNNIGNSSWTTDGSPTVTSNAATGPDGSTLVDRCVSTTSSNGGRYQVTNMGNPNITVCMSYWAKGVTTTQNSGDCAPSSGPPTLNSQLDTTSISTSAWSRKTLGSTLTDAGTSTASFSPSQSGDATALGGLPNHNEDMYSAAMQLEAFVSGGVTSSAFYPTEYIKTTTSGGITRANARLWFTDIRRLLIGGVLDLTLTLIPKGSSSEYGSDPFLWFVNSTNYAQYIRSSNVLKVSVGGTAFTSSVSFTWSRYDTLKVRTVCGNGTVLSAGTVQINGGTVIDLVNGSSTGSGSLPSTGTLDLLQNNSDTGVFSSWLQHIIYPSGAGLPLSLYFKDSTASGSSHGSLLDGGVSPTAANTNTQFALPASILVSEYALQNYNSTVTSGTFSSTVQPTTSPTTNDCWRSQNTYTGTFSAGTWTINMSFAASGTVISLSGKWRFRIWYSTDPTGTTGATEITSGAISTSSFTNPTTTATNSTASASLSSVTLTNAYLFLQIACELDSGGGSQNLIIRVDGTNSIITTPTFTMASGSVATSSTIVFNTGTSSVLKLPAFSEQLAISSATTTTVSDNVAISRAEALTVSESASMTDNLKVSRSVQDQVSSSTSLADNLNVLRKLVDSISSGSTASEVVSVNRAYSDSISSSTNIADSLIVSRKMVDSINSATTVVDAFIVSRKMVDSINSSTSISDAIKVSRPLIDAINGSTTVQDPLSVKRNIVDNISQSSVVADAVSVSRKMVDSISSAATVADNIKATRPLADTVQGSASLQDSLSVLRKLFDSIQGGSSFQDSLSVNRRMIDNVSQSTNASDNLIISRKLADSINPSVTVSPSLISTRPLTGSVISSTSVTDALKVLRSLIEQISSSSSLSDPLSVKRNETLSATSTSSIIDNVVATRSMTLSASPFASVSLSSNVKRVLVESILGLSSLQNTLAVARPLADAIAQHTSTTQNLAVKRSFVLNVPGIGSCTFDLSTTSSGGSVTFRLSTIGGSIVTEQLARSTSITININPSSSSAIALKRLISYIDTITGHSSISEKLGRSAGFSDSILSTSSLSENISNLRSVILRTDGSSTLQNSLAVQRNLLSSISSATVVTDLLITFGFVFFQMLIEGNASNLLTLLSFLPTELIETTPSSLLTHSFIDYFLTANEDVLTTSVRLMKQGDNSPPYTATLSELKDNILNPVNLTGYTATFIMTNALTGVEVINRPCVIDDAVNGKVHYDWQVGDTVTIGQYKIVIKTTNSALGITRTFPQNGYASFTIEKNL